jgi:hypothetical protein
MRTKHLKKASNEYRLHMCRIAGIGKRARYGRVNPVIRQNKNQLSLLDSIPGASPRHVHSAKPNISPRGRISHDFSQHDPTSVCSSQPRKKGD